MRSKAGRYVLSPNAAIEHGIGLIPEDRQQQGLALPLTLADNCNLISGRDTSKLGIRRVRKNRRSPGRT